MERAVSPKKKLKSPGIDATANINLKTSVTCVNVPEGLFDATAAKKHFSKFGRVQRIRLFPKKQMCIIEYDQPMSAERAVLNAGAYDGFMFDVTRTKARVRRKSRKEDDPDWVPDSDVEEELNAMSGTPTYRVSRQKPMALDVSKIPQTKTLKRPIKQSPVRAKVPIRDKRPVSSQPTSGIESLLVVPTSQASMSTTEAALELNQLRFRVSSTPDEQWRTLDARDRILRAWGGAGSRVKIGGATIGTCPDMCPEKELLHRQAEHQVMTLETVPDSDGQLEPWRAVKQYSRSSADQEIPMCYELRPAPVLMRTCAYLLHEIADTKRQVNLADWFHFMWDRLRGIRKDITQQALCCAESICLVEMCARFHAHCAARLADLEHTQFDQKLNTDNLTKCMQTLKHMYADVGPDMKPREAEFRGYIALVNLGDANFWWEIKQLPLEMQKSEPITFAIKVFNALDNNNYVRFFRLVREEATYLQACILHRYFNDVRARALARVVKAYAPRGGSKFPAEELMNALSFESIDSMRAFIAHYGLRFAKDESELCIILDRHQFIEDSDPYPIARALKLIESKRICTVGEVIAGGKLPHFDYGNRTLYSSFIRDGRLKDSALIAEDQGYNTNNDSNKDVQALKSEVQRLAQGGRTYGITERASEPKSTLLVKPNSKTLSPGKPAVTALLNDRSENRLFSFKPAIRVAPKEVIKNSPEKIFQTDTKNIFSFSKPEDTGATNNIFRENDTGNQLKSTVSNIFALKTGQDSTNLFARKTNENKDPFPNSQYVFKKPEESNIFKKTESGKAVFSQVGNETANGEVNKNLFTNMASQNAFGKNIFSKARDNISVTGSEKPSNIFANTANIDQNIDSNTPANIFGSFNKPNTFTNTNSVFSKPHEVESQSKSVFATNGDVSPGSLFKTANNTEGQTYSIFQSKNKAQSIADNIFNSVNTPENKVYDFDQTDHQAEEQLSQQKLYEQQVKEEMERKIQEKIRDEEERKIEEKRYEEEKRRAAARLREEELLKLKRLAEELRKEEERKQEELLKKIEEERKAELKRKAEEDKRKFEERVGKESTELIDELLNEVREETVKEILVDELDNMKNLVDYANIVTEEICTELCDDLIASEIKAEKFRTDKLRRKWFYVWKKQLHRNFKRRRLLDDTPVWFSERTPTQEAARLRRLAENSALKNMNAIHKGYKFIGELKPFPSPETYNMMEIIRSPLLKRMKAINYPYDKGFFWKVTLVSPGETKWMCRKVEIEKWLLDAFSDKKKHNTSESLIRVEKQSWNHLMDFSISVSLINPDQTNSREEAVEGSNGLLFYITENEHKFMNMIEQSIKHKYPYQVVPVTVVMPKSNELIVEHTLRSYVEKKIISDYKIFIVDPQNICDSINSKTKSALKWMAKKYPAIPPLEVDYLKSICQRYLGNEIWHNLKSERDGRMKVISKDLRPLVECYNMAVDKLVDVITNEDLFNYPPFPLEFNKFLDHTSPYPKPYEFIPTNARNSDNASAIREMVKKLKLPEPDKEFQPRNVISMQTEMRTYCKQIGWFEDPEQVVCKVVAKLPKQFAELDMPSEQFRQLYEHYDLIDFLNILVYEKISRLQNFDNRYAIYERSALNEYKNCNWFYGIEVLSKMKHKPLEYEDDLDMFIETKRRKIALDSMEILMLEDNDCTMVEENIKVANESLSLLNNCKEAVKQLEEQLDLERKKSIDLENLLKSALSNV